MIGNMVDQGVSAESVGDAQAMAQALDGARTGGGVLRPELNAFWVAAMDIKDADATLDEVRLPAGDFFFGERLGCRPLVGKVQMGEAVRT